MTGMDVHGGDDLAFPQSLPEFQRLFPDAAACAAYLERARWDDCFVCHTAASLRSLFASRRGRASWNAEHAVGRLAFWLAPSWSAAIRR